MELIIVTGMSGAGKSLAIKALEDIGYYCVDNMPPALMPPFLQLCRQSSQPLSRIALVTDVRAGTLFEELQAVIPVLTAAVDVCQVLFLDCNTEVLRRRFKESRRTHPLAGAECPIEQALDKERQLLAPLFEMADYRIDTTHLNSAQFKSRISDLFRDQPDTEMKVQVMSFGFKYGYPAEADIMLDVRCLPNPYYVEELRPLTGMDKPVQDYVLSNPDAPIFLARLQALLTHLLPLYQKEGRSQLVIAIGCTGGKHRSVTIVNELAKAFSDRRLLVFHRDIGRE
ncbi:MAG: RNase adapter RapZ [Clostridia bacterium]|nr:RNase adapter RapZ [Clostridia bacterium]